MTEDNHSYAPVRSLRVAVMFLTRIPTGWIEGLETKDLAKASWAFPVVGLIVGGISGAALYAAAASDLFPLACALIALCVQAFITGALHEDGLADVIDGLGGYEKTKILEIMRDSRVGSYGVLALIFSVGIRATALASVAGPGIAWGALIAAACISRGVLPMIMYAMPAARADGLSVNAGQPSLKGVAIALALGVIFLFVLLPLSAALIGIVIGASLVGVLVYWAQRRLGGQTGDVLGAAQQLIEIAVLVAAAGWSASY